MLAVAGVKICLQYPMMKWFCELTCRTITSADPFHRERCLEMFWRRFLDNFSVFTIRPNEMIAGLSSDVIRRLKSFMGCICYVVPFAQMQTDVLK